MSERVGERESNTSVTNRTLDVVRRKLGVLIEPVSAGSPISEVARVMGDIGAALERLPDLEEGGRP